ncbi:hypothetical protein Gotur_006897 [Gossypium turneri]
MDNFIKPICSKNISVHKRNTTFRALDPTF